MKRTRILRTAVLATLLAGAALHGQDRGAAGIWRTDPVYDGRFTFVRLRWGSGSGGGYRGMSSAWNHDFPRAEQNLMTIVRDLTLLDARTDGGLILALDDPRLFHYPVAMMWEPGYWTMTDPEAARFREYLLKGGFAIFDDFELDQWNNFEAQMHRVLPEGTFVKLDQSHQIFDTFFRMKTIDFPHPMFGYHPHYYGIFEDNDPAKRLMLIANHDNDVAEYWEWSGTASFSLAPTNEAYKLGVNYVMYALTH